MDCPTYLLIQQHSFIHCSYHFPDIEIDDSGAKNAILPQGTYLQEEVCTHYDKSMILVILTGAWEHTGGSMTSTKRWESGEARQRRLEEEVSSRGVGVT